jgi:hypothetical protein
LIKPSYLELQDHYTKTVTLSVPLKKGELQLALVGKDDDEKAQQKIITLVKDLTNGQDIGPLDLRDDLLWWAIKSVTADPAYPYRVIYKN